MAMAARCSCSWPSYPRGQARRNTLRDTETTDTTTENGGNNDTTMFVSPADETHATKTIVKENIVKKYFFAKTIYFL